MKYGVNSRNVLTCVAQRYIAQQTLLAVCMYMCMWHLNMNFYICFICAFLFCPGNFSGSQGV